LVTAGNAEAGPADAKSAPSALYLVQFDGAPLATYTGGVAGIAGTKPAAGGKLDRKAWNYNAYRDHIRAQRTDVLRKAKVDGKQAVAQYDTVVNGVALKLTGAEVAKLSGTPGVRKVWKQEYFKIETADTPTFLGLAGAGGAWQRQFGGQSRAGEGVIVGVLDTGITPENPSFAALPEPRPDADIIAAKWNGECVAGEEAPVTCNNKLLGARFYNFGGTEIIDEEFVSPRDFDGHGSHTTSTAAGNGNVAAVVNGDPVGTISGMAPAARVAAYKICWELPDFSTANCGGLETIAALDDATADGVDVVNYSIGGSSSTLTDLVNLGFLNAAAAGVFVATSAGNTPGPSTVAHNVPWVTTVAASTHDRTFEKSLTLGNGTRFTSAGIGGALPSTPLIDSVSAVLPPATAQQARLCAIGSLDPAKVTGKIVVCERGVVARTDKSRAVKQAGGVGMVHYNPTVNSINADFHAVPTIHVGPTEGATIKAYIAGTAAPTGSMTAAVKKKQRAPQIAAFSSSGPAIAAGGDLLKPDITAPGVDVIAAVAPPNNFGNNFDALSGTSMSSPHIAGIAALLRSKNPTWSPMMVKSAIMTTAGQTDNTGAAITREGGAPASPLDYGAGHVRPGSAFSPGLVYDSGPLEWVQFACGAGEHLLIGENGDDACELVGSIDPSNLNYASISVGDLAGKQTITRTVQNTTNQASIYFANLKAPAGYTVKVTPSVLTVLPRRTATYKVEITRTTAAFGSFAFGSLTWADLRGHSVRSPIALRAVPVAAPADTVVTGVSGSRALSVRAGYTGTLTARPFGLVASQVTTRHLVGTETGFDTANPAEGPAVMKTTVVVPAGSKAARFATLGSEYPVGTDLDLFVYRDGELWDLSAGGTADEQVTVGPGTYDVYVVQFGTAGVTEQDVHLHSFIVPPTAAGNFTATPASQSVSVGQQVTITAGWSGLTAGRHYLGVIEYGNGTTALGLSLFTVHA
jgi:subtilisin family serine protease